MRKWITGILIISLLLFGNTAVAKGGGGKHKHHKSHSIKTHECSKTPASHVHDKKKGKHSKKINKHGKKCENKPNQSTDGDRVSADKAALQIGFSGNDNTHNVTVPLVLPTVGANGSTINWSSNKPHVISHNGSTIVRPVSVDEVVTMTATIRRNQATTTKSFDLIVKAIPNALSDAQKVAADKAALEIKFTGSDTINHVTKALESLPTKGVNGSTISWVTGNPSVISIDGKTVIRPEAGKGDAAVTMIAIIQSNSSSDTKVFQLTVKQQLTDAEKVAADKAALQIDFGGSDTLSRVTRPFDKLPTIGENGSMIVWYSSSPGNISNDGKQVIRPQVNQADMNVIMTALITRNGITDSRVFNLTVKREYTTHEKLAADKADLAITFSESDSATNVTKSISLPTSGYYGSAVVWVSHSPAILANNGTLLTRPNRGAGDTTVTLTAYISHSGIGDSKTFTIVVKQQP